MTFLLSSPLLLVAALAAPLLLLVVPWRAGWLFAVAVLAWADSSLVLGDVARKGPVRFALLSMLFVQGAIRLRGRGRGLMPPTPLVLLGLLAAASTAWSETPLWSAAFAGAFLLVTAIAHGFLARYGASAPLAADTLRRLLGVMAALLVLGFVPWLRTDALLVSNRLRGFFGNPNGLGLTCALLAPLAALGASRATGRERVLGLAGLAALAGLAFLSGSRSGFGGVVLGTATTWFLLHPSRFLLGVIGAGLLVSVASLAGGDVDLDRGAVATLARTDTVGRISGRLERWEAGLERFREAPLLGHGFRASFGYGTASNVDPDAPTEVTATGTNYHSQHIETLVDLGLVGELLFLWTLLGALRRAVRVARRPEPDDPAEGRISRSAVAAALAGTLAAATVDSFFHNWFFAMSPYAFVVWSLVGLLAGLERRPAAAPREGPRAAVPARAAAAVGVP